MTMTTTCSISLMVETNGDFGPSAFGTKYKKRPAMATFLDAKLAGMMAGMSAKAERHPSAEYDNGSLRDAWLRGFDEMQQSLGTWSPALPAQQVAPNVTDAECTARKGKVAKEEAEAEPEPPPLPSKRSMLAIVDDNIARQL
jgi:hypothetical protein